MTSVVHVEPLLAALEGLSQQVGSLRLPLEVRGVDGHRRLRGEVADQLGDYVLPRLRRLDAPVLAVVGGPTGAGKSTLVNSLVRDRISAAGVIRPTTRAAVLVHNPVDSVWFDEPRILPGLQRTDRSSTDPASLQLVSSEMVPAGLALLDAPDIDSVVTRNRVLATQLLSAADMWLFVTTAARYADAVPWEFLRTGVTRGTAVAIVLDRVPSDAVAEVRTHLAGMLTEQGLGGAPLFVIPETTSYDGLLPPDAVEPIRSWLTSLAADANARAAVVRHTLDGAVRSLSARVFELASAADAQSDTSTRLRSQAEKAYDEAIHRVEVATGDGTLLRGEVLARWQELVGTGDLMRSLEVRVGRLRDRVTAAAKGKPAPADQVVEALESGVAALVRAAADEAAERVASSWGNDPAGRVLLSAAGLGRSSESLPSTTERAVREWQGDVLELVRTQAKSKRATARYLAFGVNGLGLMLMIVVFAHTAGLTGGEIVVAGGATALSQKLLEAVLGDQAVRSLAATARADLHARIGDILDAELRLYTDQLDEAGVDRGAAMELRAAAQDVEDVR